MNKQTEIEKQTQLEQLRRFLTYRISRVHWKLNSQASKILHETVGITLAQWRIIAFIGGSESITATELVKLTAMDKGLVSRNVKALIADGIVTSLDSEKDNRVHMLSLTPKGRSLFDVALPRMQQRQAKLQQGITPEDLEAFHRVIDALELAAEDIDP